MKYTICMKIDWEKLAENKAYNRLSEILELEEDHGILLRAIQEVFNRAYGKPRESMELSGKDGKDFPPVIIQINKPKDV